MLNFLLLLAGQAAAQDGVPDAAAAAAATPGFEDLDYWMDKGIEVGTNVLIALVTLIIGWMIAGWVQKLVVSQMTKREIDVSVSRFLGNIVRYMLIAATVIAALAKVGIETTSVIAILGSAGLAIGLALQGSLGNFAGGVLILFFKPYRLGDIIEAQGYTGRVWDIQIFNTILITYDNQRIVIPNGLMSNGCIKNIFVEPQRRVDIEFGISYGDSIEQARAAIQSVIDNDDRILSGEQFDPNIFVSAHADSSINMLTRVWVNSEDYWPVYFGLFEQVKYAFDKAGITIPFPQRDVHLFQQS